MYKRQLLAYGSSLSSILPTVNLVVGVVVAMMVAMVLLGGVKRIGSVTEKLVPFMALFYLSLIHISVLTAGLRALGLRVIDGKANYLLFRAPADLNERLRPLGTQVRSCANYPGLGPEWYRTAVRTAPENARLLELMKEVLG